MNPTIQQLAYLRNSRPHRTKLWLSIYKPNTVLSAQINDTTLTADKGTMVIGYDNASGSAVSIENGMTMFVGTTPGDFNVGKIRVRSASLTTGTVTVAENSDIRWTNNDYITIVDFHEVWPVFPRIIQNPADKKKTIWYKDYDIVYSNQNTINGAFPCMGSNFAGFLDDNNECLVYYSASGSAHVNDENMSFEWWFNGATVTGSTAKTPGYITYTTPGHYTTRLRVSGTSSCNISYRHVSIYDRLDEGPNQPIALWELNSLQGSRDSGGYVAEIRIHQPISEKDLKEGSLVVVFADDWYGTTKTSIGGNQENRDNIVFSGYVQKGSIHYDYKDKYVSATVESPTGMMKVSEGFSVSVEYGTNPVTQYNKDPGTYPSPWILIPGLNVRKSLWHYLNWHSTVLQCVDFQFTAPDQLIQFFDADRTSLFDAVDSGMRSILLGKVCSDMQGRLWAEQDLYLTATGSANSFAINGMDWIGEPSIEEVFIKETSFVEMGGIKFTGVTGSSTALLSGAPGSSVPGYRGTTESIQGLALSSQTHLNTLSGALYSYRNRKYPRADFNISGNYRNLDIAPQVKYPITVPADKSPRGVEINADFFIETIDWKYDPVHETFIPNVGFSQIPTISDAISGETIIIPPYPPTDGDGGGWKIPPWKIPPFVIPTIVIPVNPYLFVPALGGSNGAGSPLVYAGGPYCGSTPSLIEFNYIGTALLDDGSFGAGIFVVPPGVKNLVVYAYVVTHDAHLANTDLYIEASSINGLGYGEFSAVVPAGLSAAFYGPVEWTEIPLPGEVVRIYGENLTGPACMYLVGWNVVFTPV